MNNQEECQVLRNIASTRCGHNELGNRLESVVTSLAAYDPFLACELRVKAAFVVEAIEDLKRFNPFYVRPSDRRDAILGFRLAKRAVERLLFYLAWQHGVFTLLKFGRLLLWGGLPKDPEVWQLLAEIEESYRPVQSTEEAHNPGPEADT